MHERQCISARFILMDKQNMLHMCCLKSMLLVVSLCKICSCTHVLQVATYREQKKMADKNRKLQEKAHRMKEESLRDDDNVFDVAFENQGGEAAEHTVSATDIKVCTTPSHHSGQHTFAAAASSCTCSTRMLM